MVFDVTTISNGENAINVLGQTNFTSAGTATTQSGMDHPYDVAYDSNNGRLFVIEYSNRRILVFDVTTITNGENAIQVIGQDDFTSSANTTTQNGLYFPYGSVYSTSANRLFVTDRNNSRIMVYTIDY